MDFKFHRGLRVRVYKLERLSDPKRKRSEMTAYNQRNYREAHTTPATSESKEPQKKKDDGPAMIPKQIARNAVLIVRSYQLVMSKRRSLSKSRVSNRFPFYIGRLMDC
jgi:hypothetical protein